MSKRFFDTESPDCQSYSPVDANVHVHLKHTSLSQPESIPKKHLDWFSLFCTAHSKDSLYCTMGAPFPSELLLGVLVIRIAPWRVGGLDPT